MNRSERRREQFNRDKMTTKEEDRLVQEGIKKYLRETQMQAIEGMQIAFAKALNEYLGWGRKRIQKALEQTEAVFIGINESDKTIEDVRRELVEKVGLKL